MAEIMHISIIVKYVTLLTATVSKAYAIFHMVTYSALLDIYILFNYGTYVINWYRKRNTTILKMNIYKTNSLLNVSDNILTSEAWMDGKVT